jgi:hypothetical protein
METRTAQGYGITATLTPDELRVKGNSKPFHFGLVGAGSPHEQNGVIVLPLDEIAEVKHSRPKLLGFINGGLVVRMAGGRKYEMRYRAKKQRDFAEFADAVVEAVGVASEEPRT